MATKITVKPHIGNGSGQGGIALKSESQSKNLGNSLTRQFVYQGTKEGLQAAAASLDIGAQDTDYGYLTSWEIRQDNGPFWNLTVNYSNQNPYSITVSIEASAPTTYTCTTIMKSMPLETSPNYRYIWNHVLIYLDTEGYTPPAYSAVSACTSLDYKSLTNASSGHLKWVKDANEMPTDPVYQPSDVEGEDPVPHYWKIAYQCSKPGVEYYEFPTYEITQSSRSRGEPTWWKQNLPGKVVAPRKTFGITGGEWLCHGGQIHYDGKAYDASCTYQWTPDVWDRDLYNVAQTNNGGNPILP